MTGFLKKSLSVFRFRPGRKFLLTAFIIAFLAGYNSMSSYQEACLAQATTLPPPVSLTVAGGMCVCCKGCFSPCEPSGMASTVATMIYTAFTTSLQAAVLSMETFTGLAADQSVQSVVERLNMTEMKMIDWWNTLWWYNVRPAMMGMTDQINVGHSEQSRVMQSSLDAAQANAAAASQNEAEVEANRAFRVTDNNCPEATLSGGLARGAKIGEEMRSQWQKQANANTSNKVGSPGEKGASALTKHQNAIVAATFCDPAENGGQTICTSTDANLRGADTQVTKFIYNKLTIPVDSSPTGLAYNTAVETAITNLTVSPAAEVVSAEAMASPQGQEMFLDRRSFMARANAARSVPQIVSGWRMPGSQIGSWVREVREAAGVPAADIHDNPSYREVVHAMVVDRYNSGNFALDMIADKNNIEVQKLTVSALYLMQLRDYHDLLERTALTLAVQVAIMADQQGLPETAEPVR